MKTVDPDAPPKPCDVLQVQGRFDSIAMRCGTRAAFLLASQLRQPPSPARTQRQSIFDSQLLRTTGGNRQHQRQHTSRPLRVVSSFTRPCLYERGRRRRRSCTVLCLFAAPSFTSPPFSPSHVVEEPPHIACLPHHAPPMRISNTPAYRSACKHAATSAVRIASAVFTPTTSQC